MRETQVRSLGQDIPLEEEVATDSSIRAWEIPWTEEPGRLQSTGSQRDNHRAIKHILFHILFLDGLLQNIEYSSLHHPAGACFSHCIYESLHLLTPTSQPLPPSLTTATLAFVEDPDAHPTLQGRLFRPGPRRVPLESFCRRVWVGLPGDAVVRTARLHRSSVHPSATATSRHVPPPRSPLQWPGRSPAALWLPFPCSQRPSCASWGLALGPRALLSCHEAVTAAASACAESPPVRLFSALGWTSSHSPSRLSRTLCPGSLWCPPCHNSWSPGTVCSDSARSVMEHVWAFCSGARPGPGQLLLEETVVGSGFDGHNRGQTSGVGEGRGGLAGCRPRGCREPDTTERPNSTSKGEDSGPSRASSGHCVRGVYPRDREKTGTPQLHRARRQRLLKRLQLLQAKQGPASPWWLGW